MGRPISLFYKVCVVSDTFSLLRDFFSRVGVFVGLGPCKTPFLFMFLNGKRWHSAVGRPDAPIFKNLLFDIFGASLKPACRRLSGLAWAFWG